MSGVFPPSAAGATAVPAADAPAVGAASRGVAGIEGVCLDMPLRVSAAEGADARGFLNGQLSSDVKTLAEGRWQLSSYSTPKGRALATFAVAAEPGAGGSRFWLLTRPGVADATFRRLGMFVLRSKVAWHHDSHVVIGVAGVAGAAALAGHLGVEMPAAGVCVAAGDADRPAARRIVCGLGQDAWWVVVPVAEREALGAVLAATLPVMDAAAWDAIEVAAGRPWVEEATREAFVPQMLNLDLTGGISFKKGCYPGQEIVARTQYLGKVKRRMLRFAVDLAGEAGLPAPGAAVYAAGGAGGSTEDAPGQALGQALGQVVIAAPFGPGRAQLLAVLQMDLAAGADLRLGAANGPALAPLELPYALDPA